MNESTAQEKGSFCQTVFHRRQTVNVKRKYVDQNLDPVHHESRPFRSDLHMSCSIALAVCMKTKSTPDNLFANQSGAA